MNITINGKERTVEQPCSVHELLAQCGLDRSPCAVEVNAQLVPKRNHAEHALQDGDQVEVVTLVGGG